MRAVMARRTRSDRRPMSETDIVHTHLRAGKGQRIGLLAFGGGHGQRNPLIHGLEARPGGGPAMAPAARGKLRTWLPAGLAGILAIVAAGPGDPLRPAVAQDAFTAARDASQEQEPRDSNLCVGCHTPVDGPALSGILMGSWLAPNITPDLVSGIGAWSRDDVFRYLRSGNAPGRAQASGPMAPVVEALQDRPDADLQALVDWLARQPAHRDPAEEIAATERGEPLTTDPMLLRNVSSGSSDPMQQGAALYNGSCASCHGADGAGSPGGYYPSMFHNAAVGRRTPYNIVAVLLNGVERKVGDETVMMPSFDGEKGVPGGLSDDDLAVLTNFLLKQFGDPAAATVEPQDIDKARLGWWGPGEPSAERGHLIVVGGQPLRAGVGCFGCHGLQGQGDAGAGFPRLAGLDATYFAKQMRDYASGARLNGAMSPIAQQLDPADHQSAALYYAQLPVGAAPVPVAAVNEALVRKGAALYAEGSAERGIQACAACHGPDGRGFNPVYPSIIQPAAYTDEQLRLWQSGERRNDPHDLMGVVARRMTDQDIRAVSAYLAGLAP